MKKKTLIIVVLALLVIGGGVGTGIYISYNNRVEAATISETTTEESMHSDEDAELETDVAVVSLSDTETIGSNNKPKTEEADRIGKEKEESPSQVNSGSEEPEVYVNSQANTVPTEQKPEVPANNENTGNSNSGVASEPVTTPEKEKVWHEPVYEDVWVEDTPAWTEEVTVYETRYRDVCNGCGTDITSDIDGHLKAQMLAGNTSCGGYHLETYQVQIGTETETHPAEGHWEQRIVKEGYWE